MTVQCVFLPLGHEHDLIMMILAFPTLHPVAEPSTSHFNSSGVGRCKRLKAAVLRGDARPPVDLRYLARPSQDVESNTKEVYSFLQRLYDSVAETLPDVRDEDGVQTSLQHFENADDPYAKALQAKPGPDDQDSSNRLDLVEKKRSQRCGQ